ncbi:EYxxD motif small membrane protein [Aneurinibacillus tyrosinisolvens]|jgi:hypothetical protein|nr:EYxxD motif small membrane protein [Aneurinibacillus tyrosinisolvens]
MNRFTWEMLSDNTYVIVTVLASLAIVVYVWLTYNSKKNSRYKS